MGIFNMEKMKTMKIAGRNCYLYMFGQGGRAVYWGIPEGGEKEAQEVAGLLANGGRKRSFILAAYEAEDWNRDFSPWAAPPVFGDTGFLGGGKNTLSWLLEQYIPVVEAEYQIEAVPANCLLAGYSLAGLFSMWAFYESDCFGGVASCSGSLWYPLWEEYIQKHSVTAGKYAYLSLGKKEEKTRNSVMAQVGEMTRFQYECLKNSLGEKNCALEYWPGGHFSEVPKRMCHGIEFLLQESMR